MEMEEKARPVVVHRPSQRKPTPLPEGVSDDRAYDPGPRDRPQPRMRRLRRALLQALPAVESIRDRPIRPGRPAARRRRTATPAPGRGRLQHRRRPIRHRAGPGRRLRRRAGHRGASAALAGYLVEQWGTNAEPIRDQVVYHHGLFTDLPEIARSLYAAAARHDGIDFDADMFGEFPSDRAWPAFPRGGAGPFPVDPSSPAGKEPEPS
jgi:hypothetical protein